MKLRILICLLAVTATLAHSRETRADFACPFVDYSSYYGNYTYYAAVCYQGNIMRYEIVHSSEPLELAGDCACSDPIYVRTANDEATPQDTTKFIGKTIAPDGKPVHIYEHSPKPKDGPRKQSVETESEETDPTAPRLLERDCRFLRVNTDRGTVLLKATLVGQYAFNNKTLLSAEMPVAQVVSKDAERYAEDLSTAGTATIVSKHGFFQIVRCDESKTNYIVTLPHSDAKTGVEIDD